MRQTARARAPDAAWEGYLIDDITPLFPFSLPLCLCPSFPLTSVRISTRAQTIFALSPPSPSATSLPLPPRAPFFTQKALLSHEPTINRGVSQKAQGRAPTITGMFANAGSSVATEEMRFSVLGEGPTALIPKGQTSPWLPVTPVLFGFLHGRGVEIVPRASCNSPRK